MLKNIANEVVNGIDGSDYYTESSIEKEVFAVFFEGR